MFCHINEGSGMIMEPTVYALDNVVKNLIN